MFAFSTRSPAHCAPTASSSLATSKIDSSKKSQPKPPAQNPSPSTSTSPTLPTLSPPTQPGTVGPSATSASPNPRSGGGPRVPQVRSLNLGLLTFFCPNLLT